MPRNLTAEKPRYTGLDVLRGLSLLSMIGYHTVYDLVYIFDVSLSWFSGRVGEIWQQSICWSFIFLSGFCWPLGGRKWRRGALVLACSMAVTTATLLFLPEQTVHFGVLCLIGSGMLLLIPLERLLRHVPGWVGFSVSFLLFLCLRNVNNGSLGIGEWSIRLPNAWYANSFTTYLGFPPSDFVSSDYFSLFPWLMLYLTGYFAYGIFRKHGWLQHLSLVRCKPLQAIGRHSLLLYMLHQPVIYGILLLIFRT